MHGETSVLCVLPLTPFKAVAKALKARLVDEPITSKECRCMLMIAVGIRRLTHSQKTVLSLRESFLVYRLTQYGCLPPAKGPSDRRARRLVPKGLPRGRIRSASWFPQRLFRLQLLHRRIACPIVFY